ncbi:hypothetical protein N9L33_05305 [Nitrospinae bacterium]|nr:hypothetical protein [Nitrospinota bacterium]
MISRKLFIKEKNIQNIRGTNYGVIVIRIGIFIITLFSFASIALALNWQDKKVAEAGCPKTANKDSRYETLKFKNEKIIDIQDTKILIIGNHNSDEYLLQNKHSFNVGGKLIKFLVNTVDQEKENYLKVRPRLITTKIDYVSNSQNC